VKEETFAKHADIVEQKQHPQSKKNLRQINKTIEKTYKQQGQRKNTRKKRIRKLPRLNGTGSATFFL
jgi:hypothetical protein